MKPDSKAARILPISALLLLFLTYVGAASYASALTITVTSANPNSAPQGAVNLNVTVNGNGFKKGATAKWFVTGTTNPGGVTVNSTAFVSSSQLTASITVAQNAVVSKFDIVVTNADGRTGKGTELFAVTVPDPAIAFTMDTYRTLMVMNSDGTNQLSVLQEPSGTSVYRPNWSPDHSQLVFEGTVQGDGIYVMDGDGSNFRKVIGLNNGAGEAWPVWSPAPAPDGKYKIAFSDQIGVVGQLQNNLFLVNPDGTGLINLTNTYGASQYWPTWDPYAMRLAAQVYPCPPNTVPCTGHLYVYDLGTDANGAVQITNSMDLTASGGAIEGLWVFAPEWGRTPVDEIVFMGRQISNTNYSAIWIVSLANPSNPFELTATGGADWPSWSPDDSKIVFRRKVGKTLTISRINADGSGFIDLGVGDQPTWRRCCPTCTVSCSP